MRTLPALLALSMLPLLAAGQTTVYRCVDDGAVTFQQMPCRGGGGAVEVSAPNLAEGWPTGEATLRAEALRSSAVRQAIAERRAMPGMTPGELRQALGTPAAWRVAVGDGVEVARWDYRPARGVRHVVHLRGGVVVGQEHVISSRRAAHPGVRGRYPGR